MKKTITTLLAGILAFAGTAQELPAPSPLGKIEQKVGLTDITIEYSRPSVKDRTIFGDLVPFEKMWRLGANSATTLEISTPITIENTVIPKGKYSLQAIPVENTNWIIIINSDAGLRGLSGYKKENDIIRFSAKSMKQAFTETLTLGIDNVTNNSASISIQWEKIRVEFPIELNTEIVVGENIDAAISEGKELEKVYSKAASYYSGMKDYKTALSYVEKSLKVKQTHSAMYTKAEILKAEGKREEAIKTAKSALELAKKAESKGWASYIEGNIKAWEKE